MGDERRQFEPDDDARPVYDNPLSNYRLIQWLSWAIWYSQHDYVRASDRGHFPAKRDAVEGTLILPHGRITDD